MAQADSVPSSTRQLITGWSASQSTNLPAVRTKPSDLVEADGLLNRHWYGSSTGPIGSEIGALFYATAAFFLRGLPRNRLLIQLLFLSSNKCLRLSALDKVSSTRLADRSHKGG
jgi:hypothetical protein